MSKATASGSQVGHQRNLQLEVTIRESRLQWLRSKRPPRVFWFFLVPWKARKSLFQWPCFPKWTKVPFVWFRLVEKPFYARFFGTEIDPELYSNVVSSASFFTTIAMFSRRAFLSLRMRSLVAANCIRRPVVESESSWMWQRIFLLVCKASTVASPDTEYLSRRSFHSRTGSSVSSVNPK